MKTTSLVLSIIAILSVVTPCEARGGGAHAGGHVGGGSAGAGGGFHMGLGYPGGGSSAIGGGTIGNSQAFSGFPQSVARQRGYGYGYRRLFGRRGYGGYYGMGNGYGVPTDSTGVPLYNPPPLTAAGGNVNPNLPTSAFVKNYSWNSQGSAVVTGVASAKLAGTKAVAHRPATVQ